MILMMVSHQPHFENHCLMSSSQKNPRSSFPMDINHRIGFNLLSFASYSGPLCLYYIYVFMYLLPTIDCELLEGQALISISSVKDMVWNM